MAVVSRCRVVDQNLSHSTVHSDMMLMVSVGNVELPPQLRCKRALYLQNGWAWDTAGVRWNAR